MSSRANRKRKRPEALPAPVDYARQHDGNLRFVYDLVRAYEAACSGITDAPLSLNYWSDSIGGFAWKLVFVASDAKIKVFALESSAHWRRAEQMDMEVGAIFAEGKAAVFRSAPTAPPELDETLKALSDLCAPCRCIASDMGVLEYFGTSVRCRCSAGWIAAVQRGAAVSRGCPFTGMDFGDGAAQHPSWSQWMARWHSC